MSKAVKVGIFVVLTIGWLAPRVQAASRVEEGSSVTIAYSLEADDRVMVPKTNPSTMDFVVGSGKYPKAFERQLIGLKAGAEKNITLKPEEAFGPVRPELVKRLAKSEFPANIKPVEGRVFGGKNGRVMRIAKVLDDSVVIDQNHPLAGRTLKYHVMVKEIQ